MATQPDLILASQSPRRQALLQQIGVRFAVIPSSIPESPLQDETPNAYVMRLANAKARAIGELTDLPVLGADTVVVHRERLLEKPVDKDDAIAMLMRLSGSVHQVLTAVSLTTSRTSSCILCETSVLFRDISAEEAERYWRTGEPRDKAGGYGIQGLGAVFVRHLAGSYSNVVGLPLAETAQLLQESGISIWNRDLTIE